MKSRLTFLLAVALLLLSFSVVFAAPSALTARQVAQRVYARDVGQDMQMSGTMELISKSGHVREREMLTLRLDTPDERRALVRFTAPPDIRDTAFLVIEDTRTNTTQQYLYLPALKRTRRIVGAQQGRSFVNSDFTYEDMQRHPLDEWVYAHNPSERMLEQDCYVLVSTPEPDTKTQYSKIISWVEKNHFIPLRICFWDQKGVHVKTYTVENVALVQGVATEMAVLMENHEDQHQTRLTTRTVKYNTGLPERMLTTRALEP